MVAHKATLVNALSRATAERLVLMDYNIGRKGFLTYLKSLGGSNVIKIVPASVSASESQANGDKRLKVVCGANTSYLEDSAWIGDKTPVTLCELRVSPHYVVVPNIGSLELAEALARDLPFTADDDNRPVLQCVKFEAKEGKLTMVSADGFSLAIASLDLEGEGLALISREELKGVINALRRARRARVSFEPSGDTLDGMSLVVETELIRYKWTSVNGSFPEYEKLIPTDFKGIAHFDTVEALKAVNSLKVLADSKAYPIDLTINGDKVIMANPDDRGQAEIPAETEGEVKIRIDGSHLIQVLRACGGMVELKLTKSYSPMLFSHNGYRVVVMPMLSDAASADMKRDTEEKAQTETSVVEQAEAVVEAHQAKAETRGEPAESKPKLKGKSKVKKAKPAEPVPA